MKKKSFFKIFFVGTGNALNAGMGLFFLSAVARSLSLHDFGKYALLTSLLVSVSRLIDFGTNSTYVAENDDKNLIRTYYAAKLILFILATPISLCILTLLGFRTLEIYFLFTLGLFAYGINYTLFGLFQKTQHYLQLISLNTFPALIKLIFGTLIFFNIFNPTFFNTFSIFALSVFSSSILFIFLPRNTRRVSIDFKGTLGFLVKTFPAGVSQVINDSWPAINNAIAKTIKSFSDVGIFSVADKVSRIFTIISLSIFTVLLPKNALRRQKHLKYDFAEAAFLACGILGLATLGTLLSKTLVINIFGDKFMNSVGILNILIFASAFTSINAFLGNYFFITKKTKSLAFLAVGRLVLFIVGAVILIPPLELKGLALAQLISSLGALVAMIVITQRIETNEMKLSANSPPYVT